MEKKTNLQLVNINGIITCLPVNDDGTVNYDELQEILKG